LNTNQIFVKLHGSLNWIKLEDGSVVKTDPNTFTRYRKKGSAMLYPIQQKDLYLHPWITLFRGLKQSLRACEYWYIVGYAFNDEFIFEIFKEAFSQDKKMLIINPHAKEIKKRFPIVYQDKIIALPMKFGGKFFKPQIEEFQKEIRTIEFKIHTKSDNLQIVTSIHNKFSFVDNQDFHTSEDRQDTKTTLHCESNNRYDKKLYLHIDFRHVPPFENPAKITVSTPGEESILIIASY